METPASTPLKLIFSCSGAADVGELADRSARALTRAGAGKMYCLAGVGGRLPDMIERTRTAGQILAIDGCAKNCVHHLLHEAGITTFTHLRLADLGMEKGKSPVTEERIAAVVAEGRKALA
jgi:uncharacterized metal-binding protein